MTLSRILVANRGEIALRVVRTARDLGATSILPYTPEDLMSPAAELADEAYAMPEGSSYTDAAAVLELARTTGADAVHPGYGFLSEDADFARSIIEAGITWVGPSPEAMDALGDKMSARATAERAKVAPVPGITDSVTDAETVISFAGTHGYPVALKRTDGGGGRGITVLHNDDEVRSTPAFESAALGEAPSSWSASSRLHATSRPSAPETPTAASPSSPPATAPCSDATRSSSRRPRPPSCPRALTTVSSRPPAASWRRSTTSE
ncbi:carbamoyl-phosphate synthase L chain, N-terminal domain protein [Actinomyces naeslundii str. Howell 279]|uniref:Carbamoyl-phosphate synthase L chain, N-terminal domain protein n=1 Tax=Actinomyces naeslundii (strain ATCC 12104 / DSM 43013 / CCUG 2238 / JCM 8349 / NCTC 10301 / Howell 279) TaxID=1115803 RepID=J3JJ29_ACTNH|nr:carbamoyl-phosphate synthase L chain, N-terminal domain protein [Actinomyces naeslundii str. Howell 279]